MNIGAAVTEIAGRGVAPVGPAVLERVVVNDLTAMQPFAAQPAKNGCTQNKPLTKSRKCAAVLLKNCLHDNNIPISALMARALLVSSVLASHLSIADAEPFVAGQFVQTHRTARVFVIAHQSGRKSAKCPVVESRF